LNGRLPLYFNGKFYGGSLNGVHRVADRLIRECDDRLAEMPDNERPSAYLLTSKNADWVPKLNFIERRNSSRTGQFWEQFLLPIKAADGVLINLANLAPIAHSRKITMVHDAQFLRKDSGYPARQRIGYRWLVPQIARTSRATITVSEYSKGVLARAGISPQGSIVVPNGADHILDADEDPTLRLKLGLPKRGYVVVFGSAKRYKNVEVVFAAFGDRRLDGISLVVIGPDRAALAEDGIIAPSQAIFAGRPADGELRGLLSGALALAFPSRTEGFGLPPLEAMLCGCPVIASKGGAIPEACGDAAIYAELDDPSTWQTAILALQNDAFLRSKKISEGYANAAQFTWRAAGERLMAVVKEASLPQ
jgi:glycosyltransferase involved in cell wall biosynthesis